MTALNPGRLFRRGQCLW